jgi:DNA uptake protein ComE-like DNA-binding protein
LNKRTDGSSRTNIGPAQTAQQRGRTQIVQSLAQLGIDTNRVRTITLALRPYTNTVFRSTLEFYIRSQMTAEEFALVEDNITASSGTIVEGLVNVNTASETVLRCIPGIGTSNAPAIISYRLANSDKLTSIAWVKELISASAFTTNAAITAGRYLTGQSYQFTADIAALGHHDRGFQRVKFVYDTTEEVPKIIYRQDLTQLGWALGAQVREDIQLAKDLRP